jgi:O-antigen ligase
VDRVIPAPSSGYLGDRGTRRWSTLLIQACLVLASLAVGRAVVETQAIHASAPQIALAAAGIAAGLAVMLSGPVACIAAIAVLTVLRLLPQVSVTGGVDLYAADPFYCALVCWWALRAAGLGARTAERDGRSALRGGPVLLLLSYVGLTLLYVAAVDPGRLSVSFVSWLRLLETASLGWFAASFLRTRRDVTLVLTAIAAAGVGAVVLAVAGGAGHAEAGPLGTRGGGIFNANELGLVSGLLVLMAAFGALGPSPLHRAPLAVFGAAGLVQSQSVGSLVGTSIALLLGLAFMVGPSRRFVDARVLRAAIVLGVAVAVAYGLAAVIRPENLPTSQGFDQNSAGERTVLAAAGLELVERNPLIGVGWRRSEEPEVIGNRDLNAELRARFRNTRSDFFPDVSPASVHNAYVQVAADLGLIGFGLLIVMFVSLGRRIGGVLKRVRTRTPEWSQLWFLAWGLILIAVWWNDNPIFGAQTETVVPALFVGAIAGLGREVAERSRPARPREDLLSRVVSDHARH